MKKNKKNEQEQMFNKVLGTVATIKKVFASMVIAQGFRKPQLVTVLTLLSFDVVEAISKASNKSIREAYEELWDGIEVIMKFDEEQQKKETKNKKL